MSRFVIDASAVAPLLFLDESHRLTDGDEGIIWGSAMLAPRLWAFEVANMLLVAMRRGRITPEERTDAFTILRKLEVRTDDESERRAWTGSFDIAVGRGLTLYDSAYLELAIRENCGLLTLDAALASAARASGISVPLDI